MASYKRIAPAVWTGLVVFLAGGLVQNLAATESWTANDDMLLYFQAVKIIQDKALEEQTSTEVVRTSLKALMNRMDAYSAYYTLEEFKAFQTSQQTGYSGIGMELIVDRDQRFICVPYPASPAAAAAIQENDRLIAVDNVTVTNKTLMTVGPLIRGPQNTSVSLTLERGEPASRLTVQVTRQPMEAKSVLAADYPHFTVLRIFSFTANTEAELKQAMEQAGRDPAKPVMLDLRGNQGGSLFEAIDAASLFLNKNSAIVEIHNRSGKQAFKNLKNPLFPETFLYILQDERTASAAEVFSAALTQNRRAVSVGRKTYGKGVTQKVYNLMDGSALVMTDGRLITPDGTAYNTKGLEPGRPVPEAWENPTNYLAEAMTEYYLYETLVSVMTQAPGAKAAAGTATKPTTEEQDERKIKLARLARAQGEYDEMQGRLAQAVSNYVISLEHIFDPNLEKKIQELRQRQTDREQPPEQSRGGVFTQVAARLKPQSSTARQAWEALNNNLVAVKNPDFKSMAVALEEFIANHPEASWLPLARNRLLMACQKSRLWESAARLYADIFQHENDMPDDQFVFQGIMYATALAETGEKEKATKLLLKIIRKTGDERKQVRDWAREQVKHLNF